MDTHADLIDRFACTMRKGPKTALERLRPPPVEIPSITTTRSEQLKKVQEEALALFENKNTDYGDAFATYGSVGVLVRLGDKIARLQTVSKNSVQFVNNEKLRDTLIDLHNYAAMAIMLLDED